MSGGALAAYAARVRALRGLTTEAAKIAAPIVLAAVKKTASAGTTPGGAQWQPTKVGGRPLVNAADRLTVEIAGAALIVMLTGIEVLHNWGTKRLPKRQILPDPGTGGLPHGVVQAMKEGSKQAFAHIMSGR